MDKIMNKIIFYFAVAISLGTFVACGDMETIDNKNQPAANENSVSVAGVKACGVGRADIPYTDGSGHLNIGKTSTPFILNTNQATAKNFLTSFSTEFNCLNEQSNVQISNEVSFSFLDITGSSYPRMSLDFVVKLNEGNKRLRLTANDSKKVDFEFKSNRLYAMYYFDKQDIVVTLDATRDGAYGIMKIAWSGNLTLSYTDINGQSKFAEIGTFNGLTDEQVEFNL